MKEELTAEMVEVVEPTTPPEDTDEVEILESEQSAKEEAPPSEPGIKPYTDEEASRILETGGKLDSSRLTQSQKLLQQSFERHSTKVWQDAAEARKAFEAKTAELSKPKTIYDAFNADPVGVKRSLNEMILQKEAEDPFSEDVLKLKRMKGDLEIYEMERREYGKKFNGLVSENLNTIRNAIPDFNDSKAQEITDFAIKELGFTNDEVEYLTDHRHGNLAAKVTIAANKLMQRFNAGSSAEKKIVKPTAPALGRAGESGTSRNFTRHELAKMMIDEPEKYQAMQPQILQAYKDGAVK